MRGTYVGRRAVIRRAMPSPLGGGAARAGRLRGVDDSAADRSSIRSGNSGIVRPAVGRRKRRFVRGDASAAGTIRRHHVAGACDRHDRAAVQAALDVGSCRHAAGRRSSARFYVASAARRPGGDGRVPAEASRPHLRKLHVTAVPFGSSRAQSSPPGVRRPGDVLRRLHRGGPSDRSLAGLCQCRGWCVVRIASHR